MNLDSSFEDDLREAVLDDVEHEMIGKPDNIVHQTIQRAHDILREYGSRNDYNIEPIIESMDYDVERSEGHLRIRIGWAHEAAPYFEFGTSDHEVSGNPLLSFIWEDAPAAIHDMFPNTERVDGDPRVFFSDVEVAGLPESRFVRDALNWLRREIA